MQASSRYHSTGNMVFLNFTKDKNRYGQGPGVNAVNSTSDDIKVANARLNPFRQQCIQDGRVKAIQDDPGYISSKTDFTSRLLGCAV
jgi:hypothetical protein